MRRTPTLDRAPSASSERARTLLVLWQHPATSRIHAIGTLAMLEDGHFEYRYTAGSHAVSDLRPLPGLPDFNTAYESADLPAIFGLRIMERARPDFGAYAESIGLDPKTATPWEQIVHSGGRRSGDTLQFMELPTVRDGRARARFFVNGVRHVAEKTLLVDNREISSSRAELDAALGALSRGDSLRIAAEENNPFDRNACLVVLSGRPLGWVPQPLSESIRELMATGEVVAHVVRAAPSGTPSHTRLVVDMDVSAPTGFCFDREGLWEPATPSRSAGLKTR